MEIVDKTKGHKYFPFVLINVQLVISKNTVFSDTGNWTVYLIRRKVFGENYMFLSPSYGLETD
jgi:hypothetical protein